MGLNDEKEKLRQAKEWLTNCEVNSQHFKAAWEHITWLLCYTSDPDIRTEAQKIANTILGRNCFNLWAGH